MNVLLISPFLPYPPDKGTSIRNWNLCRRLVGQCQFWLLALIYSPEQRSFVSQVETFCRRVETVMLRRQSKLSHLPGLVRCLLSGQPLMNKFARVDEMATRIQELTSAYDFDVIQIDGSPMAPYIECIASKSRAKTVLTFIDVEAVKLRRQLSVERKKARTLIDWIMMRRWEARYAEHFDMCLTMSGQDARLLKAKNPRLNVRAIPNGVDTDVYKPLSECGESQRILLIGYLHHAPWEDAVLYFHREVFPYIRQEIPTTEMLIVGDPTSRVRQLASENVTVVGYVDDVRPYYQQSALSVVPLRAGGGTRLKILESMALGRPVVSTSVGCEGLDVVPGQHLLVADDPRAIAGHVISLLKDLDLRRRFAQCGRALAETKYDWNGIAGQLLAAYKE